MRSKNVDGRDKPGHDGELIAATRPRDPRQNSTAERDAITVLIMARPTPSSPALAMTATRDL